MAMSRGKVLDRLNRAHEEQTLVRVRRRRLTDMVMDGYVVGVSDRWVVIQELVDAVYFEGFEMLRIRDITSVRKDKDSTYVERALLTLGRPESTFSIPQNARTRDVLEAAAATSALIGFHSEQYDGEPMWIGKLQRLGKKRFDLLSASPGGKWDDKPDRWRYKNVTRVEFGGRYYTALEQFGDPMPTQDAQRTRSGASASRPVPVGAPDPVTSDD